jgi:Na+/H+ antiporter NhaC
VEQVSIVSWMGAWAIGDVLQLVRPWLCIAPPLLTILLAIITRRVVPSLLLGIATAVVILLPSPAARQQAWGDDFSWLRFATESIRDFAVEISENHLWASISTDDHLRVFAFTSLLGMLVALIHRSGGMEGIVRWSAPLARTRRGGQVLTWLLGMVIFIDDYANTLLLGSTMRPIADRLKISREKLAYLVDSTAAPVAGLALVSTWVATEISAMQTGFEAAGLDVSGATFGIFVQTLPGRFYVLYALAFVLFNAWLCRDFGPMLAAERRALRTETKTVALDSPRHEQTPRAVNAVVPILITLAVAVLLLITTGYAAVEDPLPESAWQAAGQIVGQGNSYVALLYGALTGLAVILLMILWQGSLSSREIRLGMLDGFLHVLPALGILWLAWSLSTLTGEKFLNTGAFLASKIVEIQLHPGFMPTIIFLFASGIAFATGTSWGTMAILMPIAIPLVHQLLLSAGDGMAVDPYHPVMIATIGSVLAGAIFGDHCSPISDTTILSSRSCDCDHIAHVRTQMPYAIAVGLVSILLGTLPAGFGVNPLLLLPLGLASLLAILFVMGRRPE